MTTITQLVQYVRDILAGKVKFVPPTKPTPVKPAPPAVPPPVPPPIHPPVQPPVIITPPTTTGPGPAGATPVATALAITTQPSSAATSGVPFTIQPVIQVVDQFGAPFSGVKSISVAVATGSSILSGSTPINSNSSGVATFSGIELTNADTCTLRFTSTGLTSVTSNSIVVSSGSGFPTPTIVWNDWAHSTVVAGATGIQMGGLVGSRNFTAATPGHSGIMVNPTGSAPWKSGSPNVVYLNFDHGGAPDENYFLFANPFGDYGITLSYGDDLYISQWVWFNYTTYDPTGPFRKTMYANWNVGDQTKLGSLVIAQFPKTDNTPGVWAINQRDSGFLYPSSPTGAFGSLTWHYVEMHVKMDSAPGVADGTVTVWLDDETTPAIGPTTTQYTDANYPASRSVYNLNALEIGSQLENGTAAELRYLGPCAVSATRIGKL